jgi:hypothetical protein
MKSRVFSNRGFGIYTVFTLLAITLCLHGSLFAGANEQTSTDNDSPHLRASMESLEKRVAQLESKRSGPSSMTPRPSERAVKEETLAGYLTCAALATGSHQCSKGESLWGCTLRCADGSQYVLQTGNGTYVLHGPPSQLQHFAADYVTLTGTVNEQEISYRTIAKRLYTASRRGLSETAAK